MLPAIRGSGVRVVEAAQEARVVRVVEVSDPLNPLKGRELFKVSDPLKVE